MSWGIVFRARQRLKGSLWVVPFLGAALGPVLGQLTLWLDRTVQVPEAWRYSAATATSVLGVLVGAMVGLVGVAGHRAGSRLRPADPGRHRHQGALPGRQRPEHRGAVDAELCKLDASVADSFPPGADQAFAGASDRQGIGGPARLRPSR